MKDESIVKVLGEAYGRAKRLNDKNKSTDYLAMKNECYQRTPTDELFPHKPNPRDPIPEDRRANWAYCQKVGRW